MIRVTSTSTLAGAAGDSYLPSGTGGAVSRSLYAMAPSGSHVNETIDSLAPFLINHPELHTVILYGSAARGRLRRGGDYPSDLDIAVAALEPLSLADRADLATELEGQMGLEVDLVDLHTAHGGFLKEILSGGRVLRKSPEFVAAKHLEVYDYDLFLAPQLRAARERRIKRYFAL